MFLWMLACGPEVVIQTQLNVIEVVVEPDVIVGDTGTPTDTGSADDSPTLVDADGDGFDAAVDCDDHDAEIHPDAVEIPIDGIDQDCDLLELCFRDTDTDTYGDGIHGSSDLTCTLPGNAIRGQDCDDSHNEVWPGAPEIPNDGIDQDCDGVDAIE